MQRSNPQSFPLEWWENCIPARRDDPPGDSNPFYPAPPASAVHDFLVMTCRPDLTPEFSCEPGPTAHSTFSTPKKR